MTDWILSFVSNHIITLWLSDYTTDEMRVQVRISQESSLSLILYLFYNTDLLESCTDLSIDTHTLDYIDDIVIIIQSESIKDNNKVLVTLHKQAITWSVTHALVFTSEKYELVHFTKKSNLTDTNSLVLSSTVVI